MTALEVVYDSVSAATVPAPGKIGPDAEANRAQSRLLGLAGILAHELKNPLASAITNIAVAAELSDASDPRRPFLDRAAVDLDRVGALLKSCMDLVCADRVSPAAVSSADLLASLRSGSKSRSLQIRFDEAADLWIDKALVLRAIENVVENASRVASHVSLDAYVRGDEFVFRIEDDGPGVSEGLRDRIFDPLVSGRGGSGLGLAFVRRVCRAHGGDARLCEKSNEHGACFELSIARRAE